MQSKFRHLRIRWSLPIVGALALVGILAPALVAGPGKSASADVPFQQSEPGAQGSHEVRYTWPHEPAVGLPAQAENSLHFPVEPALPSDCAELAPPGESPPEACVYGFVLLDGAPQAGVPVTLTSQAGQMVVLTGPGPSSSQPYFLAALSWAPLSAAEGEIAAAQVELGGEQNATQFQIAPGMQQVDIWLSATCGPTYVSGVITIDAIWQRECSPYIVTENLLVYEGVTLTILPGTTILFDADKSLRVDGELLALGDELALLHFTANGAGTPGAWAHILFSPTSVDATFDPDTGDYTGGTILVNALVDYAGGTIASDKAAIRIDGSAPFLTHTFVRHSGGDGVRAYNYGIINFTGGAVTDSEKWGVYNAGEADKLVVATSEIARNAKGGIYSTGTVEAWVLANQIHDNPENYAVYVWGTGGELNVGLNWIENNGGGIYSIRKSYVAQNVILGSTTYGGLRISIGGTTTIIHYNVFYRNANPTGNGGAMYIGSGHYDIHENVIADNQAKQGGGVALWGPTGSDLAKNAILNNSSTAQGGGLFARNFAALNIQHNTILNNRAGAGMGGVYIDGFPLFQQNNLYGNQDYDLFNGNLVATTNLIAEYNWWGTADEPQILEHIWDYLDDSTLSLVDFDPWFTGLLIVDAPISPPTGLAASKAGSSIQMSWNANPEGDTQGYLVYYDTDEAGFPYQGQGAQGGNSPINVGNVLSYTLNGLPDGIYHVAVTAYDAAADGEYDQPDGHESWFANDQEVAIGNPPGEFGKTSPTSGATGLPLDVTLSWGASAGTASYEYCVDTTDDNSCNGWTKCGTSTSANLTGLLPGTTYYWQVRAINNLGVTSADGSSTAFWWFSTASLYNWDFIPLVMR